MKRGVLFMAIMNNSPNSKPDIILEKDNTTGIYNKSYVEALLSNRFPHMWLCTLMLIDIDDFKFINEKYGKSEGDKALREVSLVLTDTVGELGTVARYEEDMFIIRLPLISKRAGFLLAEKLVNMVERAPIYLKGEKQYITVSIGVCTFLKDENRFLTLDQWIKATENALLKAKAHGKNMIVQL